MFWPRFENPAPARMALYPENGRPSVVRRMYQGHLEIGERIRQPVWNFQTAKWAHVLAFTAIGDVDKIRVRFKDNVGEEYNVQPALVASLLGGYSEMGSQPLSLDTGAPSVGQASYIAPFVFEPNLVLSALKTLSIEGHPVTPYVDTPYRIDFVLHVVELPVSPRAPK